MNKLTEDIYTHKFDLTNDNPFVVMNKFVEDFVHSIQVFFYKYYILKGMEDIKDLQWMYNGKGIVAYRYTETIHHPAGYHPVGTLRMGNLTVDTAAYSEWDEDRVVEEGWDVIRNCSSKKSEEMTVNDPDSYNQPVYKDVEDLMDLVFNFNSEYRKWSSGQDLVKTPWSFCMTVILPAFKKVAKYW